MTQTDLAKVTNLHVRTIQAFETGGSWPRPETLAAIERLGLGWEVGRLEHIAEVENSGRREIQLTMEESFAAVRALRQAMLSMGESFPEPQRRRVLDKLDQLESDLDEARRSGADAHLTNSD